MATVSALKSAVVDHLVPIELFATASGAFAKLA